jgi:uncharacterized membrane protein YhhN
MTHRARRLILGAYALAATANVVAAATTTSWLDYATKPLLMPLLAAFVALAVPRSAPQATMIAALLFAWAGDCALMGSGTPMFLTGMGLFLGAHVFLITTFVRAGGTAAIRARPWVPATYGVLVVALLATMWSGLGGLAAPIAGYAAGLGTMAAFAAGFGPVVAVGGALFLLSDMLIALDLSGLVTMSEGWHGLLVMTTYTIGLALLATGWAARGGAEPFLSKIRDLGGAPALNDRATPPSSKIRDLGGEATDGTTRPTASEAPVAKTPAA